MAMDWEYIGTKLVAPGVGCLLANVMVRARFLASKLGCRVIF
jgi:hypothetical protein